MELQTKIPLGRQSENQIDYDSSVLLIGSCFSDNIGKKLEYFRFKNFQNPFGILFHPKAIETLIKHAVLGKTYSEADVFFHIERWHCFDVHSQLSSASREDLLRALNKQVRLTQQQLKESTHIVITLGTAWVYRFTGTSQLVANCHKIPQKEFQKELLSIDTICQSLEKMIELIRRVNSNASLVFTVSPVRHLKDGFVENTQSKAHLISAIRQVLSQNTPVGNQKNTYFPSYELMMDELRDYRFYKEDMIHPNDLAVTYIWEKFKSSWISETAYETIREVDSIQRALLHKPFDPNSETHKKFLLNLEVKIKRLQLKFTHISFENV
ncbi:GSCFA domain-containing protein [uncultured Algibacter sp.]|uniref:GSCFA domain-containing protein n=1 Tax=uncultured Algibacter sp. TaxID=298659 RepID=UPI002618A31D|nr:GSCFA domain-containing protein [uncultured Algibacter sp.]